MIYVTQGVRKASLVLVRSERCINGRSNVYGADMAPVLQRERRAYPPQTNIKGTLVFIMKPILGCHVSLGSDA